MSTQPEFPREEAALIDHRAALRDRFPLPVARPRRLKRLAAGACTLGLVAALTWWLDPPYRSAHHATAVGQRQTVALTDGSRVTLNTGTVLDVSWHLRSRRLQLRQGEALFEVAHSTHRPFVVEAGGGAVEVTGTAFNLRLEAGGARVTVVEGRVIARDASVAAPLIPGEEIAWTNGQFAGRPVFSDPARALAWREGKLVFERTPLKTALAEIQRHRAAPIVLLDDGVGELRISGVYDADRSDALLELLPAVLPVQVVITPGGRAEVRGTATH